MTDRASGGQPLPSVVEIRPSVRRLLGQWAIQSITLGRGFFPGIVVHLGGWDNVMGRSNRVRLDYGPGGLFARRSQESVRAQIESWWLEHRGARWRPVAPAEPLRFPPGVDPYAPPARD